MGSRQYRLKFRNHVSMMSLFSKLFKTQSLVDVTLVCDKVKLKAHKAVLAACSPYFQEIFEENPCKHPVVVFDRSHASLLPSVLEFVYDGEANIMKDDLNGFLALAESFQICDLGNVEINRGSDDASVRVNGGVEMPVNVSNCVSAGECSEVDERNDEPEVSSAADLDGQMRNGPKLNPEHLQQMPKSPTVSDDRHVDASIVGASVIRENVPDKDDGCGARNASSNNNEKTCEVASDDHNSTSFRRMDDGKNTVADSVAAVESTSKPPEQTNENNAVAGTSNGSMKAQSNGQLVGAHDKIFVKLTPAKKDRILELFYERKKSYDEISDAVNISAVRIGKFITGPNNPVTSSGKMGAKKNRTFPNKWKSPSKLSLNKRKKIVLENSDRQLPVPGKTSAPLQLLDPDVEHQSVPSLREMEASATLMPGGSSGTKGSTPPKNQEPKRARITPKMKNSIIDMFLNRKMSYSEIGRRLNVPVLNVKNMISRHSKATAAKPSATNGTRHQFEKLDAGQQAKLLEFIGRNKKITQVGIQTHVKKEFGKSISILAISKLLRVNDIKLDRPTSENSRVIAQNSLASIDSRYEYALALSKSLRQNKPLVFIDECAMESRPGTGLERTSMVYVLSALNKNSLLRMVSQKKPFGPEAFCEFLQRLHLLLPPVPHVFVMSDVALHRSLKVNEWIRKMKYVRLFLPARSPFLNPLQKLFRNLQKVGSTLDPQDFILYSQQLHESEMSETECNGWIEETMKYIPLCLQRSPILHLPKTPDVVVGSSSQDADVHRRPEATTNETVPTEPAKETPRLPDSVEIIEIDE